MRLRSPLPDRERVWVRVERESKRPVGFASPHASSRFSDLRLSRFTLTPTLSLKGEGARACLLPGRETEDCHFLLGTVTGDAFRFAPLIVTPSTLPTARSR